MLSKAIQKSYQLFKEKGWSKIYWAVDIHGTVLKPNYSSTGEISTEFYPFAKEALLHLQAKKETVLILYTCSYPHEIEQYVEYFLQHGISFDYINANPDVTDGAYGFYRDKPYFNVLLDDKAGFDPENDWQDIIKTTL